MIKRELELPRSLSMLCGQVFLFRWGASTRSVAFLLFAALPLFILLFLWVFVLSPSLSRRLALSGRDGNRQPWHCLAPNNLRKDWVFVSAFSCYFSYFLSFLTRPLSVIVFLLPII